MNIGRFIKRSSIFLAIFVLLFLAMLVFVSSTHKFLPHEKYYNHEFENAFKTKDIELLAIGNSKLLASLDPKVLEEELGMQPAILACIFTNTSITKLMLESYLDDCQVKPKAVLYEVSWFTFNPVRTQFNDIGGTLILNDYKLWQYVPRYYPEVMEPLKRSIIKQLYAKVRPMGAVDYSSEFQDMSPTEKTYEFDLEEFENVFPDHIAGVDEQILEDFNAIVAMCEDNDIQLILYTAPEDEDYTSNQIDRERIKDMFKKVPNAIYIDYTMGSELYKKDYELWMKDSHHINENTLFTKVLTDEITSRLEE